MNIIPKRILIVDDDETYRESLCDMLMEEGFHCECVEHGHQALALLHSQPVDVVITDHQMPLLDGITLIEKITNHRHLRTIPVILMSGSLDRRIQEDGYLAGAYSVLTKPIEFKSLLSSVNQVIHESNNLMS